jgi:hypothetical protein
MENDRNRKLCLDLLIDMQEEGRVSLRADQVGCDVLANVQRIGAGFNLGLSENNCEFLQAVQNGMHFWRIGEGVHHELLDPEEMVG